MRVNGDTDRLVGLARVEGHIDGAGNVIRGPKSRAIRSVAIRRHGLAAGGVEPEVEDGVGGARTRHDECGVRD